MRERKSGNREGERTPTTPTTNPGTASRLSVSHSGRQHAIIRVFWMHAARNPVARLGRQSTGWISAAPPSLVIPLAQGPCAVNNLHNHTGSPGASSCSESQLLHV